MSASDRPRLFVAVELPDVVRDAIEDAVAPWRRSLVGFRWSTVEALHLTVAFIGDVDAGDVEAIEGAIEAAASAVAPIPTELTGFGAFPDRGKARVLWIGLDDPEDRLVRLAAVVAANLEGFLERDDRPYQPHLTIARARRPASVPPPFFAAAVPALRFEIDALTLFRSDLGGEAPRYERLGRWNLEAGSPEVP
jgi:2'-5' RNA ligase